MPDGDLHITKDHDAGTVRVEREVWKQTAIRKAVTASGNPAVEYTYAITREEVKDANAGDLPRQT